MEHGQTTTLRKAGCLNLEIEYSVGPNDAKRRKAEHLGYKVKCLSASEVNLTRAQRQHPIVYADKADHAWSYPVAEPHVFFISCRESLFMVELGREVS
ncbi:hypothetical protein FALBO_7188 [Fusarium albosuccineum]|uniref:Uncharacterized protein n=1 Tax=Fusarium albosuccineum TaxID=1237068 RepID=A0A8H4LBS1_9HYPO|nr:hypothetical protein FALBO_7188 [Fusarium albosuccineum]